MFALVFLVKKFYATHVNCLQMSTSLIKGITFWVLDVFHEGGKLFMTFIHKFILQSGSSSFLCIFLFFFRYIAGAFSFLTCEKYTFRSFNLNLDHALLIWFHKPFNLR